jgi:hypothetical protein
MNRLRSHGGGLANFKLFGASFLFYFLRDPNSILLRAGARAEAKTNCFFGVCEQLIRVTCKASRQKVCFPSLEHKACTAETNLVHERSLRAKVTNQALRTLPRTAQ